MSHSFRIGDLVILQHPTYYHEFNGFPAVIVEGFDLRSIVDLRTMEPGLIWCWRVRVIKVPDCLDMETRTLLVESHQIRKPDDGEEQRLRRAARDEEVRSC